MALRSTVIAACMLIAGLMTIAVTPERFIADQRSEISLSELFPSAFGDWREDALFHVLPVDQRVSAQLLNTYTATLSKTYVNSEGKSVMFSLAYGRDQRGEGRSHYPEVCYPAQGFEIERYTRASAKVDGVEVPVSRMLARMDKRVEPVTYWIVVGDEAVVSGIQQKIAVIQYGLRGYVPDGMLVRISSINADAEEGYELHDSFATDLAKALSKHDRARFIGTFGKTGAAGV